MKKTILAVLAAMVLSTGSAMAWYQGPPGPQGPQGVQGVQGIQGNQGNQGYTGATGSTGATGAQGVAGYDGMDGYDGATGAQGEAGVGFDSSALDFGLASSAALSNIPDDLGVNGTSVGVGMGFYNKTDAVALGLVHRFSESWVAKASVAQSLTKQLDDNGKHALWGVGAAYRF